MRGPSTGQERDRWAGRTVGFILAAAMHVAILASLLVGVRVTVPMILPAKPLTIGIEKPVLLPKPILTLVPKLVAARPISVPAPEFTVQAEPTSQVAVSQITAASAGTGPKVAAPSLGEVADPDYLRSLQQYLQKYLDDLGLGKQDPARGVVSLHFIIDRAGRVLFFEILKSSGHSTLDADALTLIQKAGPLPPMPASMHGDRLNAAIPIAFVTKPSDPPDNLFRRR